MMFEHLPKHAGDVAAGIITVGSLISILPSISALLSIAWVSWRFYQEPQIKPHLDAVLIRLGWKTPDA